MDLENRRYSDEEVDSIIRRALHGSGSYKETVSHSELVDIARKSGVSASDLEEAILYYETEAEFERAKEQWLQNHRNDFYKHLRAYLIVNSALLVMNLMVSRGYIWAFWPIMGWGIGLMFHAADTFFVDEKRIERGARRLMRKRRRQMRLAPDRF